MIPKRGLLGIGLNFDERYITDSQVLDQKVRAYREMDGGDVVVTQGSYDLLHVGHMRFLHEAWQRGDLLIVLLDSDEKVRGRKGKNRPVTKERERAEMLCHLRWVNVVFLKPVDEEQHKYVRLIKPDILIVSESTGDRKYTDEKVAELKALCSDRHQDSVVVLPPQAEDSTTAKVRRLIIEGAETFGRLMGEKFAKLFPQALSETLEEMNEKSE